MLVTTKLRIHLILAILGLILQIIIFASPGWAVFRFPVDQYVQTPIDKVIDNDEGTRRPPVAMAKREVSKKMVDDSWMMPHYKKKEYEMSVRVGLWYFVTCIHRCHHHEEAHNENKEQRDFDEGKDEKMMGKVFDNDQKHKDKDSWEDKSKGGEQEHHDEKHRHHCSFSTFENAQESANKLPYEMRPARLVYTNMHHVSKTGLIEFRIEAVVGLLMSILGVIFTGLYKKSFAEKRCHGLAACLSLLLSGVLYAVAIGKTLTAICQARAMFEMNNWETLKMPIPWCLILGAIAAALTLIVGVSHIFTLSRERTDTSNCYVIKTHHVKGSFPFHTLAPPGYEPKLSLLNPTEEAGPLPEKPAI